MTALFEWLLGLAIIFTGLVVTTLIVVVLSAIMPPREQRQTQAEIDFRAACAAVKGNAAWNGRHWECLK
jgi:uncharacterized membrane protein YqjE